MSQCCAKEASCSTYKCAAGYLKKSTSSCGKTTCAESQCCIPQPRPSRTGRVKSCKVYGDPYVESFDRAFTTRLQNAVTTQSGTFYLVRAPDVQIQAVFERYPAQYMTKLMVTGSAVGNKKRLEVQPQGDYGKKKDTITYDGKGHRNAHFSGNLGNFQVSNMGNHKFRFSLPLAGLVLVTSSHIPYMDAEIFMNEGAGLTAGLCGRFKGQADDTKILTGDYARSGSSGHVPAPPPPPPASSCTIGAWQKCEIDGSACCAGGRTCQGTKWWATCT